MRPEDILPTYDRVAAEFARTRDKTLFERRWLDRTINCAPGRKVLDLGCGPGVPISAYLADRRCEVTGVDGAGAMVHLFQKNLPGQRVFHADMRGLDLRESFDIIVAWDSFFHLSVDDQRAMFSTFWTHSHDRTVLLFTTGPAAGEAIGKVGGETVYHASLDPSEYRGLLAEHGYEELAFVPEDPTCNGHSVWLARYRG
ncbi:trans-aconitate 2-methyltransferase [uncultured Maritimibacter sp.]|uniref:class I SAM-dependent methyltransferase n=1 Tax=uncultured Maritimibacter sp. TaxID=991866 RepID=UPI002622EDFF|nr:class I SAM-dependent methyltransferase [uncultured Maritimibacter sp.]